MKVKIVNAHSGMLDGKQEGDIIELEGDTIPAWAVGKVEPLEAKEAKEAKEADEAPAKRGRKD